MLSAENFPLVGNFVPLRADYRKTEESNETVTTAQSFHTKLEKLKIRNYYF